MQAAGSSLAGLLDVYMSQYSDTIIPFGGSLCVLHAQDDQWKYTFQQQLASNATHLHPAPFTRRNQYPPVDLKQDLLSQRNTNHQEKRETQQPAVPQTRLNDRSLPTLPLAHKHRKENSRYNFNSIIQHNIVSIS